MAPPGSPLVTAAVLAAEVASADPPLVLDVRWTLAGPDPDAYAAAHVPGAVFCDLDADLAAAPGQGGRHPLPDADTLTATMRRLGVAPDRPVVAYDGGVAMAAARAWWVLRWAGHHDVRVLDGGLPAWVVDGRPVARGDVAPVAAPTAQARPGAMPVVTSDEVLARVVPPGADLRLLDARPAPRFRGETEPVDAVAGHVPGARNVPASSLLREDGTLRTPDELRRLLTPDRQEDVAATCGSGVSACVVVLALEVLGVRAALHAGSWSQWIQDPTRPVAT